MKRFNHLIVQTYALLALLLATFLFDISTPEARAADEEPSRNQRLMFSTFGTLGLVFDDSSLHPQRDFGQPDSFHGSKYSFLTDSLLGAQVDVKIVDDVDATVQMVVKDRADQTFEENLAWAFVRWRPTEEFTLRAGRLGLDLYLLSDYRNVGYAYLWQRPVVEFYGMVSEHHFDGADISYSFRLGEGRVKAKIFGGVTEQAVELTQGGGASRMSEYPLFGGKISYEDQQLRLSLGYGRTTYSNTLKNISELMAAFKSAEPLWPEAASIQKTLDNNNKVMQFFSAGAAYEFNNWMLQGEIGYTDSSWRFMPDILAGYVSIAYQAGSVTPYIVLAAAKSLHGLSIVKTAPAKTGDPSIDSQLDMFYTFASQTKGTSADQQTLSLGMRWDLYHNVALKFQWDYSKVALDQAALWSSFSMTPPTGTTHVNLLSSSINFAF